MSALNSIRPRLTIAREQDTYSSSRSRRSAGGQSRPQESGVGAAALPQGIHSPTRRERAKRLHSQAHDNPTDDDSYATESLRLRSAPKDVPDALGHADPAPRGRYDCSRHNLDRSPSTGLQPLMKD